MALFAVLGIPPNETNSRDGHQSQKDSGVCANRHCENACARPDEQCELGAGDSIVDASNFREKIGGRLVSEVLYSNAGDRAQRARRWIGR